MHSRILVLLALIAMVLIAASMPHAAMSAPAARSFPDTTDGIFVFNDQLATWDMSEAQFALAAAQYVGSQKLIVSDTRHLRQYNPNFLVLHYRLGQALGHSSPDGNCNATTNYIYIVNGDKWVREYPRPKQVQEEWFAHRNRQRVFNCAYGHYLMNLKNASWRAWWSNQVIKQLQNNENDGVFADSYSVPNYFGGCSWKPCLPVIDAKFETKWANMERAFTDFIRAQFAGRWVWLPNVGAWITSRDPSDYSNTDGVMFEGYAEWGEGNYFAEDDWVLQQNRALALINANKIVIAQTYPNANDVDERMFILGTYLLVKGTRTYVNLDTGLAPEWFPEYALDLGSPMQTFPVSINALYDADAQVYRRLYQNGRVLVNPSDATRNVNLGATYYRATPQGGGDVPSDGQIPAAWKIVYSAVTSVMLAPHQAAVLLNAAP
ncbi:MAG: hypothetical protein HY741_20645 [Chloroflexi bacterium]|nr:hypothetical protein [Chloroflexota bacterium]